MRRVAAEVNAPGLIAVVRAATGLSQSDLAVIAGWSREALTWYERGRREAVFDIRVLLGFADSIAMPREALLLPLVPGAVDEMGMDMDRRSFGGLAAGAAFAAVLPEAAVPSRVTAAHVKYLQASVDAVYAQDRVVGGGALLRPALRQWRLAQRMLKESSCTETIGRQFQVAAGYLADACGWLAFDAADPALARQLHTEALDLATSAGDGVLTGWVLSHLSGLSACLGSQAPAVSGWRRHNAARQAMLLGNRAADEARYEPAPWLHEVIACRQAYAASLAGNAAAFQAAITRAQRELERAPGIEAPAWLPDAGEFLIIEEQARGSANLGDPAGAESRYRELLDRSPAPRARAFLNARLAGIQLAQDAQRDAIATGTAVLALVENGVTSTRALNALRPVRAAAAACGDEEFCARFDAAGRSLAAA
jgi:DNA-binding XRE family transcriptional regulator